MSLGLTHTAQRLYDAMEPLAHEDAEHGYALAHYCAAIARMLDDLADLSRDAAVLIPALLGLAPDEAVLGLVTPELVPGGAWDPNAYETDERPGWSDVVTLNRAPNRWLPWLAQFVGASVPAGTPVDEARARIAERGGFRRGSPAAIRAAVSQFLTGTRTVYLTERHGSAYRIAVAVLASEVQDAAKAEAAARAQKPAGLVMEFSVVDSGDFQALRDTHADFQDVRDTFADFLEVRADPTKT